MGSMRQLKQSRSKVLIQSSIASGQSDCLVHGFRKSPSAVVFVAEMRIVLLFLQTYGASSDASYIQEKKQCLTLERQQVSSRTDDISVDVKIDRTTRRMNVPRHQLTEIEVSFPASHSWVHRKPFIRNLLSGHRSGTTDSSQSSSASSATTSTWSSVNPAKFFPKFS